MVCRSQRGHFGNYPYGVPRRTPTGLSAGTVRVGKEPDPTGESQSRKGTQLDRVPRELPSAGKDPNALPEIEPP